MKCAYKIFIPSCTLKYIIPKIHFNNKVIENLNKKIHSNQYWDFPLTMESNDLTSIVMNRKLSVRVVERGELEYEIRVIFLTVRITVISVFSLLILIVLIRDILVKPTETLLLIIFLIATEHIVSWACIYPSYNKVRSMILDEMIQLNSFSYDYD